jgi:DNA-binding transcriptional MerR regulator
MHSDFFLTLDPTPGFILLNMAEAVHIGKAAKRAGLSLDTIRFYQKLGLIKSAGRSAGGYRWFGGEQVRELTFVRHAQELGFSLTESRNCWLYGKSITFVPKCNPCLNRKRRLFGRRSTVSPDWKRSLQIRSAVAIASYA